MLPKKIGYNLNLEANTSKRYPLHQHRSCLLTSGLYIYWELHLGTLAKLAYQTRDLLYPEL